MAASSSSFIPTPHADTLEGHPRGESLQLVVLVSILGWLVVAIDNARAVIQCYPIRAQLETDLTTASFWREAPSFNGDRYRAMITNLFISELNNHDVQELWFQQDGATCHTARATIDLLKDTFGDRLISRFGPVNWPPRSCD
ncbi:uncharacterized protein TNCV_415831 [Trichonephila clavipes]|nr:uncharacterized protein TNCV_415831 [Trichonephila clavipes]